MYTILTEIARYQTKIARYQTEIARFQSEPMGHRKGIKVAEAEQSVEQPASLAHCYRYNIPTVTPDRTVHRSPGIIVSLLPRQ